MAWYEIVSGLLNLLLGGGLIVTLITLRAAKKKSDAEADQAVLTAKKSAIDNETSAMENFQKYIVDPLKRETSKLRSETGKLRRAIEKIGECEYSEKCPVKSELKDERSNLKEDVSETEDMPAV